MNQCSTRSYKVCGLNVEEGEMLYVRTWEGLFVMNANSLQLRVSQERVHAVKPR